MQHRRHPPVKLTVEGRRLLVQRVRQEAGRSLVPRGLGRVPSDRARLAGPPRR